MSVELRPMSAGEFEPWLFRIRDGYADSMMRHAGVREEAARVKAAADTESAFPEGRLADGQSVFVVEADGDPVGVLWVAERATDVDGRALFVYAIDIDEEHRGRGLGRAVMLLAEDEARRRGIERIALNVFGGNEVARNLYRSLGYAEEAVYMGKTVGPAAVPDPSPPSG
jgi:ribosomal protein S18 acetylase RimI-like enzyme